MKYLLDLTGYRVGSKVDDPKVEVPSGKGIVNLQGSHIALLGDNKIRLIFSGKQNIEYDKIHEIKKSVYVLLEKFLSGAYTILAHLKMDPGKSGSMNAKRLVFNEMKYADLNFESGILPKDFRTYKASSVFEKELKLMDEWKHSNPEADENEILEKSKQFYNKAREVVRKRLNHKYIKSADSYIDPRIVVAW